MRNVDADTLRAMCKAAREIGEELGLQVNEVLAERDAKIAEAAAVLDGMASMIEKYNVDRFPGPLAKELVVAIKDCRAMAAKLREGKE